MEENGAWKNHAEWVGDFSLEENDRGGSSGKGNSHYSWKLAVSNHMLPKQPEGTEI